ncbi:tetratricopeptide repeat protein [Mucilaginibacter sp. CAU 1740]|uniref:tetratricopeptide repeat protein n=1 Tax=Mucilaginibacter sp. CAU 1740 TaxID=3140365 RepID=UPI00325A6093
MHDLAEYFFFIVPLFFLIWIFTISVTITLHEMGHAIPALIFTKERVVIYLGSYGNEHNSIKLQFSKKFCIYFKVNVFKWRTGMVQFYSSNVSKKQHLVILIMGPLMSLILACIALYVAFSYDLHGFLKLSAIIFSVSALIDLRNIYPNPHPIITESGSVTYCDGYQIARLLKNKENYYTKLNEAYKYYAEANYHEALNCFEKLKPDYIDENNLVFVIDACLQLRLYSKAKEFYAIVMNRPVHNITAELWGQIGLIESMLDDHHTAFIYYNDALAIDEVNMNSLSNRAFTYIQLNQYVEAIKDFDLAIKLQPEYAYAWANKGYAKIKLDLLDDGLADIRYAISIDENEAYAHYALGMYHFETKKFDKALECFHRASELNPDTYKIAEKIKMAENELPAI